MIIWHRYPDLHAQPGKPRSLLRSENSRFEISIQVELPGMRVYRLLEHGVKVGEAYTQRDLKHLAELRAQDAERGR